MGAKKKIIIDTDPVSIINIYFLTLYMQTLVFRGRI